MNSNINAVIFFILNIKLLLCFFKCQVTDILCVFCVQLKGKREDIHYFLSKVIKLN